MKPLLLLLPPALLLASCVTHDSPATGLHGTSPGTFLRHGAIVLDLKTNKDTYRNGDPVTITLTTSRRATVRIFNEDAAGIRTQLWPNAYSSPSGIVEVGKPLVVPMKGSSFQLKAGPPYGINTVVAVASSAPFRPSVSVDNFFVDKGDMQTFARKGIAWTPATTTGDSSSLTGEARLLYEVKE